MNGDKRKFDFGTFALKHSITVLDASLESAEGVYCERDGRPFILLHKQLTEPRRTQVLAHELGHYVYRFRGFGSIRPINAKELAVVKRAERLADMWAAAKLKAV